MQSHELTSIPQSDAATQELSQVVDDLLSQLSIKFSAISSELLTRSQFINPISVSFFSVPHASLCGPSRKGIASFTSCSWEEWRDSDFCLQWTTCLVASITLKRGSNRAAIERAGNRGNEPYCCTFGPLYSLPFYCGLGLFYRCNAALGFFTHSRPIRL